jgi:hypothetical protein
MMRNWMKCTLTILAFAMVLFACKKSEDFVNPVYSCECGAVTWNGSEYNLLMAEYILPVDSNLLSRRYYATADVTLEGEYDAHNLNFTIEVDTVIEAIFFPDANPDVRVTLQEVNFNDQLLPLRDFAVESGIIQINANVLGGPETVGFDLIVKETYEGIPVGFPLALSGNMTVQVSN